MVNATRCMILILLFWVTLALIAWMGFSPPQQAAAINITKRQEALALGAPPPITPAIREMKQGRLWPINANSGDAASPKQVPSETWMRIAVVKDKQDASVLLRDPQGAIKSFRTGDELPDGSKLLRINSQEVVVQPPNGPSQTIRLLN